MSIRSYFRLEACTRSHWQYRNKQLFDIYGIFKTTSGVRTTSATHKQPFEEDEH